MKKLTITIALILGMAACAQTGCGPKLPPNTAPEVVVAVRGTQLTEALRAIVPSIEAEVCRASNPNTATCLGTADADKVLAAIGEAGKGAQTLGPVLIAVDEARKANDAAATESGMVKARAILGSIQGSLTKAAVSPANEGARNTVVRLLSNITTLLLAVSSV